MKKYITAFILLFSIFFILDIVLYPLTLYVIVGVIFAIIEEIIKSIVERHSIEILTTIVWVTIFLILNFILIFKLHKIVKYCILIALFFLSYFVDLITMKTETIEDKTIFFLMTITIKSLLLVFSLYLISFKKNENGR